MPILSPRLSPDLGDTGSPSGSGNTEGFLRQKGLKIGVFAGKDRDFRRLRPDSEH
jgi:hypothetical protein